MFRRVGNSHRFPARVFAIVGGNKKDAIRQFGRFRSKSCFQLKDICHGHCRSYAYNETQANINNPSRHLPVQR